MRKVVKGIASGVLVAVLAGLQPATERLEAPVLVAPPPVVTVPPEVGEAVKQAHNAGDPFVDMDMLTATSDDLKQVKEAVQQAGGEVLYEDRTYVRVRLPVAAAESLPTATPVVAVGVNEKFVVNSASSIMYQDAAPAEVAGLANISMDAMGTRVFRNEHAVSGAGIRVAVVDSGVDPGHPALTQNPDGSAKIVDWKDFTGEGVVRTTTSVNWRGGGSFSAPNGASYRLPVDKPGSLSGTARFGLWDESRVLGTINRDLNQNGLPVDQFGVLVVDALQPGTYDTVYVDTNNNRDFQDEEPLQVYRQNTKSVAALGARQGPLVTQRLNFVAADIDPAGRTVTLGFDGMEHGTQVAGVLAGFDPAGFQGVAPGVEIMALKAVTSDGSAEWYAVADAVQYAAEHGANIINVSLAGLAPRSTDDRTAPERFNQIARQYGVLIVLAAGNSGPGLSSGATVGNASEVLSVGSYYSPAMWMRDYGYVVPSEGVHWTSGMGPRADGSYVPGVIAPGGSPTTSPRWSAPTGYTTAGGTSIATPHAAGAAALLMETGRKQGFNSDWLSVKRSLELGARRIPGVPVFEQGNGVVSLQGALEYLRQIAPMPALSARNRDGNGGLLARSYRPGTALFSLTNLEPTLTRVSMVSSEDWVRLTYRTLALPYNVSRQLPLQMNPPAEPGVHSAFLNVYHLDKFGQNLTIPITYVRPFELSARNNYAYSTRDELEVGRFRRYFFEVKPGTSSFSVSARMLPGAQSAADGTAEVYVFRPDGQAAHRSAPIGANGTGLSTLFQTDGPSEGVWEVVVVARPDKDGAYLHAGYTLEATVRPGPFGELPLQLSQAPGSTVTHQIRVTNPFLPFVGRVEAVGITRTDTSQPWHVEANKSLVEDFTVNEFVARMRVEISNPVTPDTGADYDLDLYVYRYDPDASGKWVALEKARTPRVSRESVELTNLPPGRYSVSVLTNGPAPSTYQYQYRRLMGVEGFNLTTEDNARRHETREAWTAKLTIQAPSSPGRYKGFLILRNTEENRSLAWVPFEVSVGLPSLSVEPMAAQLTAGRESNVTLEIRDGSTGQRMDATLTVNGQRFVSRNGRVSLPVQPSGTVHTLRVEANVPGYQFFSKELTIPVSDVWSPHPAGVSPSQENALWRRKLMSQWP